MATTRDRGGKKTDSATEAPPRARGTRTRAPEDDISGVAAPEAVAPAKATRARRAAPATEVADAPAAEAPRSTRRKAPEAQAAPAPEAPKKRGRAKRETYAETAARRRKEKEVDQLKADLRAFAQARPGGWNHDDWVSFLAHLGERGHDVSDAEGIGSRLEQERLAVVLGAVAGLGPKRVESLVERFHTLWSLRQAGVDGVAAVPGMTRPLAEKLVEEMRTRFPD